MSRKTAKVEQTALQTFEARKAAIAKKSAKFAALLQEYDRAISGVAGGHQDWGHAGTLGNVEQLIDQALESLIDATARTKSRAAFRPAK